MGKVGDVGAGFGGYFDVGGRGREEGGVARGEGGEEDGGGCGGFGEGELEIWRLKGGGCGGGDGRWEGRGGDD